MATALAEKASHPPHRPLDVPSCLAAWQFVTGFTGHTGTAAAVAATLPGYAVTVAAGTPTFPDLTSVYCASRTLCIAVGGYLPSNAVPHLGVFGPSQSLLFPGSNVSFPLVTGQVANTAVNTPGWGGNTATTQTGARPRRPVCCCPHQRSEHAPPPTHPHLSPALL